MVKYGSKIFSEPDGDKKTSTGKQAKIYVRALHKMVLAMKGIRIFERFGFNLPNRRKVLIGSRLVTECTEWEYDINRYDWFNKQGDRLTSYDPGNILISLLKDGIDKTSQ